MNTDITKEAIALNEGKLVMKVSSIINILISIHTKDQMDQVTQRLKSYDKTTAQLEQKI
jgi:hypothetical protein